MSVEPCVQCNQSSPASQITRKILCVDDDQHILSAFKRQLRGKFEVTIAGGGPEGLELLRSAGPFAVVTSDYNMPGMNGVAFLKRVHEESPDTVLVMLTGMSDLEVAVSALHDGHIFRFLSKPCPAEVLQDTLNDCLEQYRLVISEQLLTEELNLANDRLRCMNEMLEQRVVERTAWIRRLYRFVEDLNGLASIEETSRVVVETAAEVLRSRRVSLMMPDSSGEYLQIAASVGIPGEIASSVRVPVGSMIAGHVFAEGRTILANGPEDLPQNPQRYDTDLFVSFPLLSTSLLVPARAVGVLNVTEPEDGRPYDEEAVAALKAISESAAIALVNQLRLQERNEARDATILALAKLAEHRDPETGAHLERVQSYCRMLSESLAATPKYACIIDSQFIDHIVRSSPLHDIGKVGVPDHILLKPGRLTPAEFEVMRQHSAIGGDTIRSIISQLKIKTFLEMGMQIAYFHHEKWDGSGYPKGLKSESIPLPARILALADVYDALTSKRCYKDPMPHDQAADIIRKDSGKHFDPDVVAAFVAREEDFRILCRSLMDVPCPVAQTDERVPAMA